MNTDDDDDDKVVSLDRGRALREFEGDVKVAHVEAMWGERTFVVDAQIRDLEAMRRGTEPESKPLRDPETVYEAEVLIGHIRWLANFLADQWGLAHLVRVEDWHGDVRKRDPS